MIKNINIFPRLILIIASLFVLSSCEQGCVEPYEDGSESLTIEANPASNVKGDFDDVTGGQVADFTETGFRANGAPIILKISGSWSAWDQIKDNNALREAPACKICFKKDFVDNCICAEGESPRLEPFRHDDGKPNPSSIDCSTIANQEDSNLCTCTKQHGVASDLDTYYIALNYQTKRELPIVADDQSVCKYNSGLGLYIGLFGADGITYPSRMYHLYSKEEICDIPRDSNNKCIDSAGNDVTSYIYKSANNKIFIKDDKSGNNGSDMNPSDDDYHEAGEVMKMIIYDRYYSDNYGEYKITFMSGMIKQKVSGIFEYIVGTIEDFIIGKVGVDGKRSGGALEIMYKSIVQDSTFIAILQLSLVLYITFFGFGVLMGSVEISKKDAMSRILKLALVLFFTDSLSWEWYNRLVVGFFKDGMDSIVAMFMDLVDQNVSQTSLIKVAQMDRVADNTSQATRFSYVDYVILKLLSAATHKKIWGLLFGTIFGFIYIPCIYALIAFFLYVMANAALLYINSLLKLVIVLAIGPLFILSSLFSKTESFFKNWISFLAARSMEIIILFLILYTFLIMIDTRFIDLLGFRVCIDEINLGLISIPVIKLDPSSAGANRSFADWLSLILGLGAIIFLLKEIINKIPQLVSSLVVVSGTAAADSGSSTSMVSGALGNILKGAGSAVSASLSGLKSGARGVAFVSRASGLSDAVQKNILGKMPISSPASMMRDRKIDSFISQSQKEGKEAGKTGVALDKFVREKTLEKVTLDRMKNKDNLSFMNVDSKRIISRLDKKLVEEPLQKFLQSEAKNIRENSNLYGKEMREELRKKANQWAASNLSVGSDAIAKHLTNMKGMMMQESQLSAKDAAKKFANDVGAQNKYLDYLNDLSAQRRQKSSEASKLGKITDALDRFASSAVSNTAGRLKSTLGMRDNYTPEMAKEKFIKMVAETKRDQFYREKERKELDGTKWFGKDFGKKLASNLGINIAKDSIKERIIRANSDVVDRFAKEASAARAEAARAIPLDTKIANKIDAVNKMHKRRMEKYGYIGENVSKVKIEGAPSKAQLQARAKSDLDAIMKGVVAVDKNGNNKEVKSLLLEKSKAQKLIKDNLATIDANDKRLSGRSALLTQRERDFESMPSEKENMAELRLANAQLKNEKNKLDEIKLAQKKLIEKTLAESEELAKLKEKSKEKDEKLERARIEEIKKLEEKLTKQEKESENYKKLESDAIAADRAIKNSEEELKLVNDKIKERELAAKKLEELRSDMQKLTTENHSLMTENEKQAEKVGDIEVKVEKMKNSFVLSATEEEIKRIQEEYINAAKIAVSSADFESELTKISNNLKEIKERDDKGEIDKIKAKDKEDKKAESEAVSDVDGKEKVGSLSVSDPFKDKEEEIEEKFNNKNKGEKAKKEKGEFASNESLEVQKATLASKIQELTTKLADLEKRKAAGDDSVEEEISKIQASITAFNNRLTEIESMIGS